MPQERSKDSLRAAMLSLRSALPAEQWAAEDAAREAVLLARLPAQARVVAAYASRPMEPATLDLLDALLARGCRVLLPKLFGDPDWAWFSGRSELEPGRGAIPHPCGPALGAAALRMADLVIVPCLAAGRDGSRLGTGGGWYDRALQHRRPDAQVWALARHEEYLDGVPTLPHDVAVDASVTERGFAPSAKR